MPVRSVELSTIDISPLLQDGATAEAQLQAGRSILRACTDLGVFQTIGHGFSERERNDAFCCAREFFGLPAEVKQQIPCKGGGFTRGYIGFGGESGSHRFECKEAFSYGFPWDPSKEPENSLQGPNIWPDAASLGESWRESMLLSFSRMVRASQAVARGLWLALGADIDSLAHLCEGGDTISLLRVFHYVPYDAKELAAADAAQERIGSSAHTDWGFLTAILQDQTGGLQLRHPETKEEWLDVPPQEDALVFNCGDFLSILSGGKLRSPVHRVQTPDRERLSFVFFYYPRFDAICELPREPEAAQGERGASDDSDFNTLVENNSGLDLQTTPFGQYIQR